MPSLDKTFLLSLQDDYTKYTNFIETGTYHGDTIFSMEPHFDKLYTIEYSEKYYNNTRQKYHGNKITFVLGDSGVMLERLLPNISTPSIFFLDGHWSSGDTGKSEKDCPLIEEITHINKLHKNEAIIIIDDCRLFGKSPKTGSCNEDWSEINEDVLLTILKSRIYKVYYLDSECAKNDRMIIHINQL